MALFEIGNNLGKEIEITGGPNDWDLWLCLRGTHREVSFFVDEQLVTCSGRNPKTFFSGTIEGIKMKKDGLKYVGWELNGNIREYGVGFKFDAVYNSTTRKGIVKFL